MMEEGMNAYLDPIRPRNVLHAMGLARSEPTYYLTDNIMPALAIFSAGLVVGASVALLVAPKTGRELRGDISRKASELTETVRQRLPEQLSGSENGRRQHGQHPATTERSTTEI